jgi:lipoprotein-anchoring transpeptidase ErfK/SrfK
VDSKQTEQQVKQFFSRSPIDDPLYLKKFIREHPDQKMAWYLLGREYAAQGKEGKAAYCFAQAGEVYEAFEERKPEVISEQLQREAEAATAAPAAKPDRRRRRLALLGAGFAALLLCAASASDAAAPIAGAPGGARNAGGAAAATAGPRGATAPAQPTTAALGVAGRAGQPGGPAQATAGAAQQTAVWYAAPASPWAGGAAATAQAALALLAGSGGEAVAAAGAASQDGRWVYWQAPAKLLFWLGAGDAAGVRTVRPLDPQACSCQPDDAAKARAVVSDWQATQEEEAVLRSAIAAYKQRYGSYPQQPEQLFRPYPDNMLPGLTPSMQEQFPLVLQQTKAAGGWGAGQEAAAALNAPEPPANNTSAATTAAAASPAATPLSEPLAEPLSIVVDKRQHRLALLSGNRIVRLYQVGLGGDKTPDGAFAITEKVRNPNNKSNGEFGSRGMGLSDTLYAIHGTNKPSSIGKDESHGCIRMQQNDIEELYDMASLGTKVTIGSDLLPADAPLSSPGAGDGQDDMDKGKGKPAFRLPLQTTDNNPNKVYHWLD